MFIILKEKDIVEHLIQYGEQYFSFPEMFYLEQPIHLYKKEFQVTPEWRCDLLNYIQQGTYRHPVYTEIKYKDNKRDLLYELHKGLYYIKTRGTEKYPRSLCVISDEIKEIETLRFIKENNILFYEYQVNDNDIYSFKIEKKIWRKNI